MPIYRLTFALALAVTIAATGLTVRAASPDTWQDVQTAGKLAASDLQKQITVLTAKAGDAKTKAANERLLAALHKIEPVISRLSQDPDFCKKVFASSEKGSAQGVATVLSSELGAPIRPTELKDFFFAGAFSVAGSSFHFCVSSHKACGENLDHNFALEAD